jgi:hypothetical protein
MRRALPWIVGGALVLVAGAVTAVTPDDDAVVSPILKTAPAGEAVESRTLIATVTEASFADEVAVADSGWSAEGDWLVVTIAASAATTEQGAAIQLATLTVGDRVFQSSERPPASLTATPLRVGIDTVGTLAFELPRDAVTGPAELRLTTSYFTAELDDMVAVPIDLDDLPRAPSIDLVDPELVAR